MTTFYNPPGFNFNDFDLLVDGNILYALYVKKVPYEESAVDSKKPNRYGLAKTTDGNTWEEVGDILLPVTGTWEESLWAGSISKQEGEFVIYYTATTVAGRNDCCKIGKAYSDDLIHWGKDRTNPVFVLDSTNPYYSNEPKLAFRDPFFFEYQGKSYLLFCAKDKSKPAGKQGCIGIVEEISPNQFTWMSPLYSPGIYFDGLECPALYEINNRWYLLYGVDKENGETAFRYAIADKPFGPFTTPTDNQLLPESNYNCRIVRFQGKLLLYHWFRDFQDGMVRDRLSSPKEVRISTEGRLALIPGS